MDLHKPAKKKKATAAQRLALVGLGGTLQANTGLDQRQKEVFITYDT